MQTYISIVVTFVLLLGYLQYKDNKIDQFTSQPTIASTKVLTIINDFEKEETKPIATGLYRSIGAIDGERYIAGFQITPSTITKTLDIKSLDASLKASANYTYTGSVIKYSNMEGDVALFTTQGEAFINRPDNKFAIIGECSLKAEQDLKERKPLDVMCRNGVEISEFTKIVEKRVIKPIAFDQADK